MSIEITEKNCGFQWITPQTHKQVLDTINQKKDRDHIGNRVERIFNEIKDWFFGTSREEVKKYLYDLLSPKTTQSEMYLAFCRLSAMVSEGYKNRFNQEVFSISKGITNLSIDLESYKIEIPISDKSALILEHEITNESINVKISPFLMATLANDSLIRKQISIEHKILENTRLNDINHIAEKAKYTKEQAIFLEFLADNKRWTYFCSIFNLPLIAYGTQPESICMDVKKEQTGNLKISLTIKNSKNFDNIENLDEYINISNERSMYLEIFKIFYHARPIFKCNERKIHSADLCLEFDLDPDAKIYNACLNGKLYEYIGPENDNWINHILAKTPSLEMRYKAFLRNIYPSTIDIPYINLNLMHSDEKLRLESNKKTLTYIKNIIDDYKNTHPTNPQTTIFPVENREIVKNIINCIYFNANNSNCQPEHYKHSALNFLKIENNDQKKINQIFKTKKPITFTKPSKYAIVFNKAIISSLAEEGNLEYLDILFYAQTYNTGLSPKKEKAISLAIDWANTQPTEYIGNNYLRLDKLMAIAIKNNYTFVAQKIIKYVLANGIENEIDFNIKYKDGLTLLMHAIKTNNPIFTAMLISTDVNFKEKDNDGNSVMFYAIQNNNREVIEHVLSRKDKNGQPILESLTLDDFSGKDADGNDAIKICCRNFYLYHFETINSNTLLCNPAQNIGNEIAYPGPQKSYIDLIKKLIDLGANLNEPDSYGCKPIYYASNSNNPEIMGKIEES